MDKHSLRGLLVDSATEMARVVQEYLGDKGCVVDHVSHGVDALDRFRLQTYDFLVISNRTRGMDSIELSQRLRKIQSHVSIIFLGPGARSDSGSYYVEAPVKLDDIWHVIRARMSRPA